MPPCGRRREGGAEGLGEDGEATAPEGAGGSGLGGVWSKKRVPPLRCAPVGMTGWFRARSVGMTRCEGGAEEAEAFCGAELPGSLVWVRAAAKLGRSTPFGLAKSGLSMGA